MPRTERVAGGRSGGGRAGGRTGDGGREFTVRQVGPSDAQYRCPGCDQIVTRVAHVVVWSADHLFGDDAAIGERRHWHTGCWRAYRAGRR